MSRTGSLYFSASAGPKPGGVDELAECGGTMMGDGARVRSSRTLDAFMSRHSLNGLNPTPSIRTRPTLLEFIGRVVDCEYVTPG
jgi:hypothetical protein